MKILFPTDLSDESLTAIKGFLPTLIKEGKETEVKLVHIVEQPVQGATLMVDITKILITDAENQLKKEQKIIKEQFGLDVETIAKIGFYESELKDLVKLEQPDLVVLISKARYGVMKYVSGQKSLKFIGELDAPLLIIPENAVMDTIDKIGFAIDKGESPTLETMARVESVAGDYDAKVDMVHVSKNEKENEEFYNRISKSGEFGDIAMVQKKSIREGIQLWCLQNEIDILVAVTHGKSAFTRTFSGSVTRDLVKDNLLALLIISQN